MESKVGNSFFRGDPNGDDPYGEIGDVNCVIPTTFLIKLLNSAQQNEGGTLGDIEGKGMDSRVLEDIESVLAHMWGLYSH